MIETDFFFFLTRSGGRRQTLPGRGKCALKRVGLGAGPARSASSRLKPLTPGVDAECLTD